MVWIWKIVSDDRTYGFGEQRIYGDGFYLVTHRFKEDRFYTEKLCNFERLLRKSAQLKR